MTTATKSKAIEVKLTRIFTAILQAFNSGKKGILLEGGTYSSKTYSALQALIALAQETPKKIDINIVSESVPHLKGGCIRDFFNIMDELDQKNPYFNQTDHIYRRPGWQGLISFLSADNEKALGMRRDILFINEGDTLTWKTARELISRTNLFTIVDWNPRSEFWAHEYFKDDPNWAYDHSTYLDALDVIPQGKKDDIESLGLKDPNYQQIYVLGLLGKIEGLVYPEFEQVDVLPDGHYFYGLDYGGSVDPNVLIKNVIIGDKLYSEEKFYLHNLDISQIAREMELCGVGNSPILPDPENPLASMELKRVHGFNIQDTAKGKGSVDFGIKRVNQYYQHWTKGSLNAIKEQRNYRYLDMDRNEEDRSVSKVIRVTHRWSHCMDARRYGVAGYRRAARTGRGVPVVGISW